MTTEIASHFPSGTAVIVIFVPGGFVGAISRAVGRVGAWVAEDEGGRSGDPPAAESQPDT